jgi:2-phosphoglycerate kinase
VSQPRHTDPLPLGDAGVPYSKGLMARALIAVGCAPTRAYELANRVEKDLAQRGERVVDLDRLHDLAVEVVGDGGADVVRRLRRYRDLQTLDVPIIVLIGGATGTGKSSIATEIAYRLGITRVTSTDFVRQTMRAFFSHELMPSIHYSSFEAGEGLRAPDEAADPVVAGFLEQTRSVLVGVRASIERALEEGWSTVLEGVHLVPGMLRPPEGEALVVQCVLAVEDAEEHARHFYTRDLASESVRPLKRYLDRIEDIRRLQAHIVERAGRTGVPVIENSNIERATNEVLELVFASAGALEAVRG